MAQLPSESLFGDYSEWPGRDVLDSGGERLGGVREIYLDRETGHPEWVLVDVDGDTSRFVPLADAEVGSATIRVAHTASQIKSAPGIGAESQIDQSEERRLYAHYGLGYSEDDSGSGLPDETAPVPKAVDETIASAAPPQTSWGTTESQTETFESVTPAEAEPVAESTPPWRRDESASVAPPAASTTGWGPPEAPAETSTETPAPFTWGTPETSEPAANGWPEPTAESAAPTGWGTPEPAEEPTGLDETTSPSASGWGEPESSLPTEPTPPPTPWGTPEPTEAASTEPPASSWSAAAEEPLIDAPPPAEPPSPEEIEAANIPEPPAASERALDFDEPVLETPPAVSPPIEEPGAYAEPEPEPEPALTPAVSPPELATANLAEPVVPEEVPAGPELDPVVSAASQVPPRPAQERPAWSSPPEPEPSGGALAVIKERPAVVIAAVVATVLFLIIRRLR